MINHFPITDKQLEAWSRAYQASTERQLSTMALSRSDIKDIAYVCAGEDPARLGQLPASRRLCRACARLSGAGAGTSIRAAGRT